MRWRVGSLAALVAVAAACSSGSDDTAATTAPTVPPVSSPVDVAAALDLSAPAVGGGEIDLRTYAGGDLALWFWAPY